MLQHNLAVTILVSSLSCGLASLAAAATSTDCGDADRVVSRKIHALLGRDDAFSQSLVAHSLPSLEQARAMCAGPFVEAALRLYGKLLLDMEMQLSAVPKAAAPADPKSPERH